MKNTDERNMINLQKALSKIWKLKKEIKLNEYDIEVIKTLDKPDSDPIGFMDCASVCMIRFKKNDMTKWFINNFDVSATKVPKLDYNQYSKESKWTFGETKLSTDYTKSIVDIFKVWFDSFSIKLGKEYPATFYNDDFEVILAPRINE